MPRIAPRVDENQTATVKRLRKMGADVMCLHAVGGGCPDLIVGYKELNLLIELKDGKKKPSQRRLTLAQQEFFRNWPGQKAIAYSPEGAERIVRNLGKGQAPMNLT